MKIYNPNDIMSFGKNKGYLLSEMYKYDPSYIEWLIYNVKDFIINVEAFEKLPKPTPYLYGESKYSYKKITERNSAKSLLEKYFGDAPEFSENSLTNVKKIQEYISNNKIILKEIDYKFPEFIIELNDTKMRNVKLQLRPLFSDLCKSLYRCGLRRI
jgi:hypothetical protein